MGTTHPRRRRTDHGWRWWLREGAYRDFWLFAITAMVAFAIWRIDTDASSTNHALCSLRGDLERRVANTEDFLRRHPNGVAGISAEDLQLGIDNQRRTIRALRGLECDTADERARDREDARGGQ